MESGIGSETVWDRDVEDKPPRMGSRRVSESISDSIVIRIKKLIQKNSSRYNKGK